MESGVPAESPERPQWRTVSHYVGPLSGVKLRNGRVSERPRNAVPAAPAVPLVYSPRAYKVEISMDGANWTSVATGEGRDGVNIVPFAKPTSTKFVRLTETDAPSQNAGPWSMHSVRLYGLGAPAR